MKNKSPLFFSLCTVVLLLWAAPVFPQSARLQSGIRLYGEGKWKEAAAELRQAQAEAPNPAQKGEALYWIALAELAGGDAGASIQAMDELVRIDPGNPQAEDLPYHRGRAAYAQRRYDDAVILLTAYGERISGTTREDNERKSSAYYWIGESLCSLGRLDEGAELFSRIVEQYPQSTKYEAASYRIALINQKKIEAQLLALIKWSHEESLKTLEEYQRRERSYDQAIATYQKRIADMLKDTRLADLEDANAGYIRRLSEADAQLTALKAALDEAQTLLRSFQHLVLEDRPFPSSNERRFRLLILKSNALELRNTLQGALDGASSGGL